jgi:hypothetical protein
VLRSPVSKLIFKEGKNVHSENLFRTNNEQIWGQGERVSSSFLLFPVRTADISGSWYSIF